LLRGLGRVNPRRSTSRSVVINSSVAIDGPSGSGQSSIVIHTLRHVFPGDVVALDGIELEIAAGSFVALLGPSGCGKSTLLRLIAGLEEPTSGEVTVLGHPAAGGRPAHAGNGGGGARDPRGELAFVFQDAHLLPWRTVLDNVALPLELAGVGPREARERARGPLGDVELGDALARYPDQLSGGMRMRVSIARALVTEPRLLLLDEPFAALDELTRQRLDERLRGLWARKRMTVIFVTHSLSEAVFLAQRALVMSKRPGRVVLDHAIALPAERGGAMRTSLPFVENTSILYQALEAHGALDEAGG
jgi:NitT/TauT family transport system ATP-binding protein